MSFKEKENLGMWYREFPDLWESEGLRKIIETVGDEYVSSRVVPQPHQIFNSFYLTRQPDNVKLILLGDEPNTTTHKGIPYANGLFLDGSNVSWYGNTQQTHEYEWILGQYQAYAPDHFNVRLLEGDLRNWADKGVLLSTVALTTKIAQPNAHLELWTPFTKGLLSRMKKIGLTPPIIAFSPYAAEVARSEDWPVVHQIDYLSTENFFDIAGRLMGHDIDW